MKILPAQLTCKSDFLMSPPCGNLPFSARLLHLSFVRVRFVVSFQGAERMGVCLPSLSPPGSVQRSQYSFALTVEFCVFQTAPMTSPPGGLCSGFSVYQSLCLTSPDSSARAGSGGLSTSSLSYSSHTLRSLNVVMISFALVNSTAF